MTVPPTFLNPMGPVSRFGTGSSIFCRQTPRRSFQLNLTSIVIVLDLRGIPVSTARPARGVILFRWCSLVGVMWRIHV
ncbi:MAG: hypothetical protein DWH78_10100 [Planctomycetota bacterium]|nr:MAG: hypothetical protein DWH78_10100 [Planctomycetota bacterium]